MKRKKNYFIFIVSICLVAFTGFFAFAEDSVMLCSRVIVRYPGNSVVDKVEQFECAICENTRTQTVWNADGRLLGTLYFFEMGSEPIVVDNVSCKYSNVENNRCDQDTYDRNGRSCETRFVPCTVEDDAECLEGGN